MSDLDRIISGKKDKETVYHEDEHCIAIKDRSPIAPAHFLVISKAKNYSDLAEASPEAVGHMMFVASKVAKQLNLKEGYRIVMN